MIRGSQKTVRKEVTGDKAFSKKLNYKCSNTVKKKREKKPEKEDAI